MTTLREAATQALDALEGGADSWQLVGPAIDALKKALVEDALTVGSCKGGGRLPPPSGSAPGYCKHCKQYTIEEPLPAEPVQEPVAWKDKIYESLYHQDFGNSIPLYTAPPQRKPLTEWQINDLMANIDPEDVDSWSFRQGVYATEKHHGVRP